MRGREKKSLPCPMRLPICITILWHLWELAPEFLCSFVLYFNLDWKWDYGTFPLRRTHIIGLSLLKWNTVFFCLPLTFLFLLHFRVLAYDYSLYVMLQLKPNSSLENKAVLGFVSIYCTIFFFLGTTTRSRSWSTKRHRQWAESSGVAWSVLRWSLQLITPVFKTWNLNNV